MARSARSEVFEHDVVGVYHVYNRVVRRCFLCGFDSVSGKDYSYRREMILRRLRLLAEYFAIDVMAYSILSNHFHLVLRNRPDLVESWDDREVVRRWLMICPAERLPDGAPKPPSEPQLKYLLNQPQKVKEFRQRLSDLSWLMRTACQYISRRCNAEDEQTGRFFGERFKMKRLLDEAGVLACMAYVDLNPIRAKMTDSLDDYAEVSIGERMRQLDDSPADPSSWLAPLELSKEVDQLPVTTATGSTNTDAPLLPAERLGCLPIDLKRYIELLSWLAIRSRPELAGRLKSSGAGDNILRSLGLDAKEFADCIEHYERRFFTAVGCPASLSRESKRRGRRWLKAPGRHAMARKQSRQPSG